MFGFSWFVDVSMELFKGFNYSKWPILTPGHIAILFGWFLELPKNLLNMDPRTPYLSPKYLKKKKKTWTHPWTYYVHIWEYAILNLLEGRCTKLFEILELDVLKLWELESLKWQIINFEIESLKYVNEISKFGIVRWNRKFDIL